MDRTRELNKLLWLMDLPKIGEKVMVKLVGAYNWVDAVIEEKLVEEITPGDYKVHYKVTSPVVNMTGQSIEIINVFREGRLKSFRLLQEDINNNEFKPL